MTLTKNPLGAWILALAVCIPVAAQDYEGPSIAEAKPTADTWWHRFWGGVELHRRRVNAWPEPFTHHDRELVRGPFRQLADNGWRSQNTFTDYLFDPGSNELTLAGHAKLHHILTQIPPHRRQVYVLEAPTPEETAARVTSVYRTIAQMAPETPPGAVMTTRIAPRGGQGWYAHEVEEAYRTNATSPLRRHLMAGGGVAGMGGSDSYGNDSSRGSGADGGSGEHPWSGR